MKEGRSAFNILTEAKGTRLLGSPRRRWEDNIRIDLKEMVVNTRNWVDSAQERGYWKYLVNSALNFRVP